MSGVESKVLEVVALVHENMVDAHLPEIDYVVLVSQKVVLQFCELGRKVLFSLFQPAAHPF